MQISRRYFGISGEAVFQVVYESLPDLVKVCCGRWYSYRLSPVLKLYRLCNIHWPLEFSKDFLEFGKLIGGYYLIGDHCLKGLFGHGIQGAAGMTQNFPIQGFLARYVESRYGIQDRAIHQRKIQVGVRRIETSGCAHKCPLIEALAIQVPHLVYLFAFEIRSCAVVFQVLYDLDTGSVLE